MSGLYIHIPYCVRKCLYCDFYSVATDTGSVAGRAARVLASDNTRFLDALETELRTLPEDFQPTTVFLGGGTPTELSDRDFRRLLEMISRHVDVRRVKEWTCESNPGTLTPGKAALFGPAGINRVSLGVQSFQADTLEFLGRIHSAPEAIAGYQLLREHGVTNINLDLIFAVPGSTREQLSQDLSTMVGLAPEHTSCYCLMFEPGTPLTALRDQGLLREVQDEEAADQYALVRDTYRAAGFHQYEISNFARPGRECLHNLLYWGGGEYLGCGPSAHSHWQGERFGNAPSIDSYCRAMETGSSACNFRERLDPAAKAREALVMGLRRVEGVRHDEFLKETGYDYLELAREQIQHLVALGMLEQDDQRLRLSERACFISDAVLAELV